MKRRVKTLAVAVLAAFTLALATGLSGAATPWPKEGDRWPDPSEMRFDPIVFDPSEPERFELSNGIAVYFLENRELPIVEGSIFLPGGRLVETADKVGLASLTAELLRTGGAGERSPEDVDEELDFMASLVSVNPLVDFTVVSFSSLTEFSGRTLEIVSDMLQRPAFAPDRLEVARGRYIEAIRRQNDDPIAIAAREFSQRLAPDHPVGWSPTEEAMRSFDRVDVVEFHRRHYRPNGAVIAVTGDIGVEALRVELERTIGAWQPADGEPVEPPPFDPAPQPKVYHAQKETAQSTIVIGYPSLTFDDPDFPALRLANQVLGGNSLQGRLSIEIRAKRGLAYFAGSVLDEGHFYPGLFYAASATRADATAQVIELIKAELRRLVDEPIPVDEFERNRELILNSAVFRFNTPRTVVETKALAEIYGLDPEYYERYIERIQSLTPEEVQAAARRWIDPDRMITLVVGDKAAFDQPLEIFGEVEAIELE